MLYRNIEIDEYYNSSALSQSKLKKLLKGVDELFKEEEEEKITNSLSIGSIVDLLLTNNDKNYLDSSDLPEEFHKKYYITDTSSTPTEKVADIIKKVYDTLSTEEFLKKITEKPLKEIINLEEEFLKPLIESIIKKTEYYKNRKLETNYKTILKEGNAYFNMLKESTGKTLVKEDLFNIAFIVAESLYTNKRTAYLFNYEFYMDSSLYDIYYQLPIFFKKENIECKALIDILLVEKDEFENIKKVTIFDIKTTYNKVLDFNNSIKSYRYDIQMAWYKEAIINYILSKNLMCTEDYEIETAFVVESTTSHGKPQIFYLDDVLDITGTFGVPEQQHEAEKIVIKQAILGYKQLFELYKKHFSTGVKEDFRTYNKKKIYISWDKIL